MYLKKYKNKNKVLSIWSKFCLNQEAPTHRKSITLHEKLDLHQIYSVQIWCK